MTTGRLLLAALTTASTATTAWLTLHGQYEPAMLTAGITLVLGDTHARHTRARRRSST
ncbi:hypothetical protein [Streptomyces sp. H27-C3]|uniref:hypothetical protein n=1 Tax=Streptomyces sp. H27-C3 TaxID=3046305 RepID=UPI0024B8B68A|nr:hypothetical protein [Streptomyces sp. H27-C3]MDJ0460626.1 hypothetical protein [Streptomyces sp. H27-C3]